MFEEKLGISKTALHILKQRYFSKDETTWEELVDRVMVTVLGDCKDEEQVALTRQMILNRYFIPNSPCLVNSGKPNGGLAACFVVDFKDSIEDIYKTKLDFALIAKKGGGCGTTLSKLRPKNSHVNGSAHGYAGGPVDFYDTVCKDMEVITQAGFRQMAMMGTMSVLHPDIIQFINAKTDEGKMSTTNLSVVVDDEFMQAVEDDETYSTIFNDEYYGKYKARDIFNLIVEGAWRNGEPGILFYGAMNDSPYKYSGQEILATNPCLTGDTLIQTVEGQIKIKDLVDKEIDVYCMNDLGELAISKAYNIRKTKENSEIVRVQTTRGHIFCTPDHKFYTKNRGYVSAIDLTSSDNIVGFVKAMKNEHYCRVALTGGKYRLEHRFIAEHYENLSGKDVHHIDGNYLNNVLSNLEIIDHRKHSSISNLGHIDWNTHNELGQFESKATKKNKEQLHTENYNLTGVSLRILGVEPVNHVEDVYDLEVETYHNFIANNLVVHNCGEQPLPPNGVCNLGSIDISKFINEDKTINLIDLETSVRLSIRFLDEVIDKTTYPTKDIHDWAMANRPVGLGIMGLADYYLIMGVAYGSPEALEQLAFILSFMKNIAEDESITLGEEKDVPDSCKVLPTPRRNITVLSIAPTGTISIIAGCNSGIEPIFSEVTLRNDKTGSYEFNHVSADMPHFRCAVSANGAKEVDWEEHVNTQAVAQKFVDSGVSKTINFPTHTHRETIYNAFMLAWKSGCKGLTVYRNGSRRVEVLSPKNVRKGKCPVCSAELIEVNNKMKCSNPDCKAEVKM